MPIIYARSVYVNLKLSKILSVEYMTLGVIIILYFMLFLKLIL